MTETPGKKSLPQRDARLLARIAASYADPDHEKPHRESVNDRDPSYPANQKNVPPSMKLTPTQQRAWDKLLAEQQVRQATDPEWQRRRRTEERNASRKTNIRQGKK